MNRSLDRDAAADAFAPENLEALVVAILKGAGEPLQQEEICATATEFLQAPAEILIRCGILAMLRDGDLLVNRARGLFLGGNYSQNMPEIIPAPAQVTEAPQVRSVPEETAKPAPGGLRPTLRSGKKTPSTCTADELEWARRVWVDPAVPLSSAEIAKRIGVSYSALYAHARSHGWQRGSDPVEAPLTPEEIEQHGNRSEAKRARRVEQYAREEAVVVATAPLEKSGKALGSRTCTNCGTGTPVGRPCALCGAA